jgi:hypothetical protein
MRSSSTPQSSPEHWSKDFVEHLRTVHFTLLTVSVGLIILLSSKSYDSKKAAEQVNEIETANSTPLIVSIAATMTGRRSCHLHAVASNR